MKIKIPVIVAIFCLLLGYHTSHAQTTWQGPMADYESSGLYSDPNNWDNGAPTSSSFIQFINSTNITISGIPNATITRIKKTGTGKVTFIATTTGTNIVFCVQSGGTSPQVDIQNNKIEIQGNSSSNQLILSIAGGNIVNISNGGSLTGQNFSQLININTITGTYSLCPGTTNIPYSVSIPGLSTYTWSVPSGFAITSGANTPSIVVSVSGSAVSNAISFTGVNAAGAIYTQIQYVTVNSALGAASTVTGPLGVCLNTSGFVYTTPGITNATSYSWTVPSGMVIISGGTTNSITISVTGTFTSGKISVTGSNLCGTSNRNSSATITVNSGLGATSTISGAAAVCLNASYVYTTAGITNATSYSWTVPSGMVIVSGGTTNSITTSITGAFAGGVISVSGVNSCGSNTPNSSVNITANPVLGSTSTITGPLVVCLSTNGYVYTTAGITNATSYSWTVPSGIVIVSGGTTNSITTSVTGAFTTGVISVSGSNVCGISARNSSGTISANPVLGTTSTVTGPLGVCLNASGYVYTTAGITNATSYSWTVPSGMVIISGGTTNSITTSITGSYTSGRISVTGSNVCSTSINKSSSTITANPVLGTVATVSGAASVCLNAGGYIYSIPGITNATSYAWTVPSGMVITSGTTNIITTSITGTFAGGTISVSGANVCGSNAPNTSVNIQITPVLGTLGVISGTSTVCANSTGIVYSVPGLTNATGYLWTVSSGIVITSGNNTNSIITSITSGFIGGTISVTGSNSCGVSNIQSFLINAINLLGFNSNGLRINFDFSSGLNDVSGNSYTGTFYNNGSTSTAVYGTDRNGNTSGALLLDGTSPKYMTITPAIPGNSIKEYSISLRFLANAAGGNLMGLGSSATATSSPWYTFDIYMNTNGTIGYEHWTGSRNVITSTNSYNDGKWHQVTGIYSSVSGTSLYIDNVLVASNPSVTSISANGGNTYWRVGHDSNYPNLSTYFNGLIDDVLVYNRALTSSEMASFSLDIFDNTPVCSGGALVLNSTTFTGASYSWSAPSSYSANGNFLTVTGVSASNSGTYTVNLSQGGCNSSFSKNISVNPAIVHTVSGSQSVCIGLIPSYPFSSNLSISPNYTYFWEASTVNGTSGFSSAPGTNNASTYSYPSAVNQNMWIRCTASYNGCSFVSGNSAQLTLVVRDINETTNYPSGYWNAYVYNPNAFTNYMGYYTSPGTYFNTRDIYTVAGGYGLTSNSTTGYPSNAYSYQGCVLQNTNYALQFRTIGIITASGYYGIDLPYYDDATTLSISGYNIFYDPTWYQNVPKYGVFRGYLTTSDFFEIRVVQGGGGGGLTFNLYPTTTGTALAGGTISPSSQGVCPLNTNTYLYNASLPSSQCNVKSYLWKYTTVSGAAFTDTSWTSLPSSNSISYVYGNSIIIPTYFVRQATDWCGNIIYSNVATVNNNFTDYGDPSVYPSSAWNFYGFATQTFYSNNYPAAGYPGYGGYFTMPGINATTTGLSFDTRNYFSNGQSVAFSTTQGYIGCGFTDGQQYTGSIKRTNFPGNYYQIDIPYNDDGVKLFVNDVYTAIIPTWSATLTTNMWTGYLGATDKVEFRYQQGGGGHGLAANFSVVTITSTLTGGTLTPSVTGVCVGDVPLQTVSTLVASTGSGCNLNTYQWQMSTISGTVGFANISGATAQTLTPNFVVYNTTWLRRLDTDYCFNTATTTAVVFTVVSPPGDTSIFNNTNGWNAYIFKYDDYTGYRGFAPIVTTSGFSSIALTGSTAPYPSALPGYQGCGVSNSSYSTRTKRKGFTPGTYTLQVLHDDGALMYVNDVLVYNYAGCLCLQYFTDSPWTGYLGANDKVEFRHFQVPGSSYWGVTPTTNSTATGVTSAGTITYTGSSNFCPGAVSSFAFTNTAAATGGGCFIYYSWESSTTPGFSSITTVAGLNSVVAGYTNGAAFTYKLPLYQTTYFRRAAKDACGGMLYSNVVTVTVLNVITAGTINTVPGICQGSIPSPITSLTTATGGNGTYTYLWQSSIDNSTWSSIATATGVNLTVTSSLNVNTYYRRQVSSTCGTTTSPIVLVTVNSPVTITTQPVNSTACGFSNALFTVAASGVSPTYQWQLSTFSGQYFNINTNQVYNSATFTGTNTTTLNILNINSSITGTNYRVLVGSSCGNTITSSGVALTVAPPIVVTQPTNQTVCTNNAAIFTTGISGPATTFKWQQSVDNGVTYSPISNNATFSGTNTTVLTISGTYTNSNLTGYRYICNVTTTCNTLSTNTSTGILTVTSLISNNTVSSGITICSGSITTITGNIPSGSTGNFTYIWQSSTNSISGFNSVTGGNLQSLVSPVLTVNTWFRRTVNSDIGCTDNGTAALVSLYPATTITSQPSAATACVGSTVVFNISATGYNLSYNWLQNSAALNTTLGIYSGYTTNSLTITGLPSSLSGKNFSCVVTNGCSATVTSTAVGLTLSSPVTFLTQPAGIYSCANAAAAMSVSITGTGPYNYHWQKSSDGNTSNYIDMVCSDINGGCTGNIYNIGYTSNATSYSLSWTGILIGDNGKYYRVGISNAVCGTYYSSGTNVTVTSAITNNSLVTTSQNICQGQYATSIVGTSNITGGDGNYAIYWQTSSDNTNWAVYTPTVTSYNFPSINPSSMTYLRRVVNSSNCVTSNSSSATISVTGVATITGDPINAIICKNTNATFTITAVGSSLGYQWQYATTTTSGGNWQNLSGSLNGSVCTGYNSSPTLVIQNAKLSSNNYYFRCAVSGVCQTISTTSAGASLTITDVPDITQNITNITTFEGKTVVYNFVATATGTINYQWYERVNAGSFAQITSSGLYSGANSNALTLTGVPISYNGYQYEVAANVGSCFISSTGANLFVTNNQWVGSVSTDWFDPLNWASGSLPTSSQDIIITNGTYAPVINNGSANVKNIVINTGATLSVSGTGSLAVNGNWTNNGTFVSNTGKVILNGTSAQIIGGTSTTTYYDLTIGNTTQGVKLSSNVSIKNTLSFTGTAMLTTTGYNFKLVSDASGTGRIYQISSGGITGSIIMQRYIPSKKANRFYSSPVINATLAQFQTKIYVTGSGTGFDASTYNIPTLLSYVETVTGSTNYGWTTPYYINYPLIPGTGYQIFIRGDRTQSVSGPNVSTAPSSSSSPVTIELSGTPNTGPLSLPVSYTNTGNTSADGWNFVGNPYPCEIDWDSPTGWTKTNIDPNFYVWDPLTTNTTYTTTSGSYSTYIPGYGCLPVRTNNTDCRYIASSQGFFIKATTAGANLAINENAKAIHSHYANFRIETPVNVLRLRVTNGTYYDETAIRFNTTSSPDYEVGRDALKLNNDALSLATKSRDNVVLAFNYTTVASDSYTRIPVVFNSTRYGDNTLQFLDLESFDVSYDISLWDNKLKTSVQVTDNLIYSFSTAKTDTASISQNRFVLLLKSLSATSTNTQVGYSADSSLVTIVPVLNNETSNNPALTIVQSPTVIQGASADSTLQSTLIGGSVAGDNPVIAIDSKLVIQAYPNPLATDILKVKLTGTTDESIALAISNSNGTAVNSYSVNTFKNKGSLIEINTKNLPSGMYILTVISKSGKNNIKIIKL